MNTDWFKGFEQDLSTEDQIKLIALGSKALPDILDCAKQTRGKQIRGAWEEYVLRYANYCLGEKLAFFPIRVDLRVLNSLANMLTYYAIQQAEQQPCPPILTGSEDSALTYPPNW